MKFFFPDSHDYVDPYFDFELETRAAGRIPQRDDVYAHEVFTSTPFDGILVSKAVVDGTDTTSAKYSVGQRRRLYFQGVRNFLHIGDRPIATMGDCGAFTYVKEPVPPYSVDEVIQFYEDCGFDYGVSVDHVILAYLSGKNSVLPDFGELEEWRTRQQITIELASEFIKRIKSEKCRFEPIGVVQGWDPASYRDAFGQIQDMGYTYIALGGLVPLKTVDILEILEKVAEVRKPGVGLHLFGVTRLEKILEFAKYGVKSFDSTSPLRQAFKDETDNYHTIEGKTYTAVRVPQVEGNPKLRALISSGKVNQAEARKLERECLTSLLQYDKGAIHIDHVLEVLREYEKLYDYDNDRTEIYRNVLTEQPWKRCSCDICQQIGIHVILFRGSERNRRRGFHNVYVFHQRLNNSGIYDGQDVHKDFLAVTATANG